MSKAQPHPSGREFRDASDAATTGIAGWVARNRSAATLIAGAANLVLAATGVVVGVAMVRSTDFASAQANAERVASAYLLALDKNDLTQDELTALSRDAREYSARAAELASSAAGVLEADELENILTATTALTATLDRKIDPFEPVTPTEEVTPASGWKPEQLAEMTLWAARYSEATEEVTIDTSVRRAAVTAVWDGIDRVQHAVADLGETVPGTAQTVISQTPTAPQQARDELAAALEKLSSALLGKDRREVLSAIGAFVPTAQALTASGVAAPEVATDSAEASAGSGSSDDAAASGGSGVAPGGSVSSGNSGATGGTGSTGGSSGGASSGGSTGGGSTGGGSTGGGSTGGGTTGGSTGGTGTVGGPDNPNTGYYPPAAGVPGNGSGSSSSTQWYVCTATTCRWVDRPPFGFLP